MVASLSSSYMEFSPYGCSISRDMERGKVVKLPPPPTPTLASLSSSYMEFSPYLSIWRYLGWQVKRGGVHSCLICSPGCGELLYQVLSLSYIKYSSLKGPSSRISKGRGSALKLQFYFTLASS